jgi:hypothetical protein
MGLVQIVALYLGIRTTKVNIEVSGNTLAHVL